MAGLDDNQPQVSDFLSAEELDQIRASIGTPVEEVPPDDVTPVIEQPIKRKRGRPRKVKADGTFVYPRPGEEGTSTVEDRPIVTVPAAPLTKRDEREVANRLASIFIGATGMAGQVKPYLQMTEAEAEAIANPLSSYLIRNAETIPVAKQILENYDVLAITLGVMAYVVRVYRERSDELAANEANNPKQSFADRVAQFTSGSNNGQAEGNANFVSTPYGGLDGNGA